MVATITFGELLMIWAIGFGMGGMTFLFGRRWLTNKYRQLCS